MPVLLRRPWRLRERCSIRSWRNCGVGGGRRFFSPRWYWHLPQPWDGGSGARGGRTGKIGAEPGDRGGSGICCCLELMGLRPRTAHLRYALAATEPQVHETDGQSTKPKVTVRIRSGALRDSPEMSCTWADSRCSGGAVAEWGGSWRIWHAGDVRLSHGSRRDSAHKRR